MVKSPGRSKVTNDSTELPGEGGTVPSTVGSNNADKFSALYAHAGDERTILRAWEDFLTGVVHQGPSVRLVVGNSWQRSSLSGVSAYETRTPRVMSGGELYRLRERHQRLTSAARHTLIENAELLRGTHSMLILTDPNGTILEIAGDPYTIDAGQDINLVDGGNWSECVIGTNAIGTAIAIDQAVQVHASEHYCEGVKKWTCAAAPIHDPRDHSLLGVLDISGPNMSFCQHNLALALGAARQIESALIEALVIEHKRLLEACVSLRQSGKEGVVVLDQSGCVVFNNDRVVEQIQRGTISAALGVGERIAAAGSRSSTEELAKKLPPDVRPDWLYEVKSGGNALGSLLVIPTQNQSSTGKRPTAGKLSSPDELANFHEIIGQSAVIKATMLRAKRIAASNAPILIQGETGVGKELFAQAIRSISPAAPGPYVIYNCGTASQDLIGSELFGYVRGAFTGASSEGREGRFEQADGGTLCLDEIGELPLALQPFLLRVLDEGIVYRLGDNKARKINVRLLAMTNRNLREEVEAGRFRRDLYHRIGVTSLLIPPLRERDRDIELLIEHFNQTLAQQYSLEPRNFRRELIDQLQNYNWPGNVRQLRNMVESILLLGENNSVALHELPEEIAENLVLDSHDSTANLSGLELTERQTIEMVLKKSQGNLTRAAKELGISRSTLYRKLGHYEIPH